MRPALMEDLQAVCHPLAVIPSGAEPKIGAVEEPVLRPEAKEVPPLRRAEPVSSEAEGLGSGRDDGKAAAQNLVR